MFFLEVPAEDDLVREGEKERRKKIPTRKRLEQGVTLWKQHGMPVRPEGRRIDRVFKIG